ncbi:Mitochondrial substrate carrier family protein ucpB (Solute carrier family 25 member 30 homolog) (Uncoupler protein B) [Durusdinium trenchii]|uniref:Mitochondrial substrate carrier family protein ucpB (Solute carrier family 25 member 30 homolog) (Uncoupler protein B) n=1 Tax=Durusdinium trenchii TaxID=1381693 RepID=A0ABP0HU69_9DINO
MRAFTQTGLRVGLYPRVKAFYGDTGGLATKLASGASTGALGAGLANPIDLVRVRFQGESGALTQCGTYASGLRRFGRNELRRGEGLAGLWRGAPANVARAGLLSAGQLASYDQTKQVALKAGWTDGPRLHLCSSCFSGLVAQVACMPADVVKTRLQSGGRHYRGVLHCAWDVIRITE